MICPDVWKRPMPTAPEKAIPVQSERAVFVLVWCTTTRDMMLFQCTVQAIMLEKLVTEPTEQVLRASAHSHTLMRLALIYTDLFSLGYDVFWCHSNPQCLSLDRWFLMEVTDFAT